MRSEATQPFSGRWQRIFEEFTATGDWAKLLAARTAAVDALVTGLAEDALFPAAPGAALVGVGGYGRRELFPYSDIDLLLLFESAAQAEAAREPLSLFLQGLWDAGLRVSQSVRTPAECGEIHERNAELNVSLIDQRYLAGGARVYTAMTERLNRLQRTRRHELARGLARLADERHARWAETYCHLEPNVKETPGGLRDLQIVRWLARTRHADEPPELRDALALLARTRCRLHCRAGRDDNVLSFEAQEDIAERWGDGDAAGWMRRYYRAARTVYRAARAELEVSAGQSSVLLARFQDWRTRLSNTDFSVSRERVHLRAPHGLDTSPDLLLRLFQFVARHGVALSRDAAGRVAGRAASLAAHFADERPLWPGLSEVFTLPHTSTALREMHETGALEAIFPELAGIDCLVVRDYWHRYTVDEHSLAAIRGLLDLRGATDAARRSYAGLLEEIERPAALVFALLFHDVGKGRAGEGHVDGSLEAAESAMARIQMPPPDRRLVRFLIRHHLVMPEALRSRDLFDPATARYMAGIAGAVEELKALTLMSWADVSAVHPTAMTAWRAEQLWRLYLSTYNELTRELDTDRIGSAAPAPAGFLQGFPTRYLRTHGPAEIEAHRRLEESGRARGVAVEIERIDSGAWRLTMAARDRPFLFASAAGALAAFGMNILKAEAFANCTGTVLDTFAFADPLRTLELNPGEVDRLRSTVTRVVLGKIDVRQLLRNRPKPAPPSRKALVRTTVSFDNQASPGATLIEIVAQDRPGLLYDLASAMSSEGCDIEVVLVDTEAHKAIDVFYVTAGGGKLDAARQARLDRALTAAAL